MAKTKTRTPKVRTPAAQAPLPPPRRAKLAPLVVDDEGNAFKLFDLLDGVVRADIEDRHGNRASLYLDRKGLAAMAAWAGRLEAAEAAGPGRG